MAETVIFPLPDGATYTIPDVNDEDWGQNVTDFLVALNKGVPPRSGTFALTGDLSFGASFGLKSLYFKSLTTGISTAGILRLAKTDSIGWRNNGGGGNVLLAIDGSDNLIYASTKVLLSGAVVNADINASAAIALTKLAALTTGKALQSNAGTGIIEASSVTNTELGYVAGVTSSIQAQLNSLVQTSWAAYTPTIVGFGTPTGIAFIWKRIGDTIYVNGKFISGTNTGVPASISLPNGYTILYSAAGFGTGQNITGTWVQSATGFISSNDATGPTITDGSTTDKMFFAKSGSNAAALPSANGNSVANNNNFVLVNFFFVKA